MQNDFLFLTWLVSGILALTSLTIMLLVVLLRIPSYVRERKEAQRMEVLTKQMMVYLDRTTAVPAGQVPRISLELLPGDRELIAEIAEDMLRVIHGQDKDSLVSLLYDLDIPETLYKQAQSTVFRRRIIAIRTLRLFHTTTSMSLLIRGLLDKNRSIQIASLQSLTHFPAAEIMREIYAYLKQCTEIPFTILSDCFQRFGPEAASFIERLAFEEDTTPNCRIAAIKALGNSADLRVVEQLLPLSSHAVPGIRAQVIAALGLIRDTRACPAVLSALQDSTPEVRLAAAEAAGRIQDIRFLGPLKKLLEDGEWWVRFHAATALYNIGSQGILLLEMTSLEPSEGGRIAGLMLAEKRGAAA